jgi:serine/threonine protein kinase
MMLELVLGLATIHSANLIHRDLKPENIFLTTANHLIIGVSLSLIVRTFHRSFCDLCVR